MEINMQIKGAVINSFRFDFFRLLRYPKKHTRSTLKLSSHFLINSFGDNSHASSY